MKKYLVLILVFLIFICGCSNSKSLEFKTEYESLNGLKNKNDKEHRTVTIDSDNPYQKVSSSEIIKMIDNKETFYLYVGDKLCPWCRSVIEKSIEVAKKNNIKNIYYLPIWDDDGKEILRDKYEIVDGELKKTIEGTKDYQRLLEEFDSLLSSYTVKNANGETVDTNEKRIFAPNFFYIEKGVVKELITGLSDKQLDSRGELTEEILKDQEKIFNEFFKK